MELLAASAIPNTMPGNTPQPMATPARVPPTMVNIT
jgi:hypothetical protein